MHKASRCTEEMPYFVSRSSVQIQFHIGEITILAPNFSCSHNNSSFDAQMAMKWCTRLWAKQERYPIIFSSSSVQFQGFRVITHSFITQMALKSCTQLWGASFSIKVTWAKEYLIWPRFRRFRTIAFVSVHRWPHMAMKECVLHQGI